MKHPQVIVPGHLRKAGPATMLIRQRVNGLTHIESTGWGRLDGKSEEKLTLTAHFEDGTGMIVERRMDYAIGEREGLLERALAGKATRQDQDRLMQIRDERSRKKQDAYAQLQQVGTPQPRV